MNSIDFVTQFNSKKTIPKSLLYRLNPGTWIELKWLDSPNTMALLLEKPSRAAGEISLKCYYPDEKSSVHSHATTAQVVAIHGELKVPELTRFSTRTILIQAPDAIAVARLHDAVEGVSIARQVDEETRQLVWVVLKPVSLTLTSLGRKVKITKLPVGSIIASPSDWITEGADVTKAFKPKQVIAYN